MRYKVSRQTSFNLNYNGRSSQPSLTQLQPVADTSDPLNIVQGNPNLDPSFSHTMRLRYQTFDLRPSAVNHGDGKRRLQRRMPS